MRDVVPPACVIVSVNKEFSILAYSTLCAVVNVHVLVGDIFSHKEKKGKKERPVLLVPIAQTMTSYTNSILYFLFFFLCFLTVSLRFAPAAADTITLTSPSSCTNIGTGATWGALSQCDCAFAW